VQYDFFVALAFHADGHWRPTVPVIAPAICNTICSATGKRLRRLPIRNEDLA